MVVNLKKLTDIVNPLKSPPWKELSSEILPEEILSAKSSIDTEEYDSLKPQTRQQHIEKIAFFVKNGWKDEPITIVFNKDLYPIYDGNHRLCAAIIRNDDFILANVEGDRKKIKEIAY
jgi:hypothetical protein